jgi:hypothetical protein
MVAQFITLFAGLVFILENYIRQALVTAGEVDTTSEKVSFITYLVYLFNGAVVVWPALDSFMQANPAEHLEQFKNMCASFVGSGKVVESEVHSIEEIAEKGEELVITSSPGPYHTTTSECGDTEQKTTFQDTNNQEPLGHTFEHAGGVRAQA